MKKIRCAIYTRKSNDEGLDKEFNTLEAQRDAGENYIRSQIHQGWEIIQKHYDDPGFSGGNMNRPALKELLDDIQNGFVDMIVVYKIDRLTRSLTDFSKMIEVLDKHGCSFVSVIQNFNTGDSMGRLMLNVLLSFAQFEREISSERIRDKIAASRKKGMWRGGSVPMGYQVVDKKLVIHEAEAKIIRFIFKEYLNNPSEIDVIKQLNEKQASAKHKIKQRCFTVHILDHILKNPIYVGKIKYQNETYPGQHEAIITEDIFNAVAKIKEQKSFPQKKSGIDLPGVLSGILYCDCCQTRMHTTYTKKHNRRYRYYISGQVSKIGYDSCRVGNIPAGELENLIIKEISPLFQTANFIHMLAQETKKISRDCQEREAFDAMRDFQATFERLPLSAQEDLIKTLIDKIVMQEECAMVYFKEDIAFMIPDDFKARFIPLSLCLRVPFFCCKLRGQSKIVKADGTPLTDTSGHSTLLKLLSCAFRMNKEMEKLGISVEDLNRREKKGHGHLGKIIRLTILAPDIVQAIVEKKYPATLTAQKLLRQTIPASWEEQRKKFGF